MTQDYEKALAFLERYTNYERSLRYPYDGWHMNLERVRALLDELGRPDRALPVIHIAGTKGKGSVAAMLEAMLRAAGYKTGLFTSPHLLDFRERVRVEGKMIPREGVAEMCRRLEPAARKVENKKELGPLTYFEILTALAALWFHEQKTEIAIMETGLGGRYDATNVWEAPLIAVITNISLDHTDILGSSLKEIAGEKAMIIKPGRPVVAAPQKPEAFSVLARRAEEVKARLFRVEEHYSWRILKMEAEGQECAISGKRRLEPLLVRPAGEHQVVNAATALLAADLLEKEGLRVEDDAVKKGLASLEWPARFQRIQERPEVILDAAHNRESAACLRRTLERVYPGRRIIGIIGLAADKDVEGFCQELGPVLSRAVITKAKSLKAASEERISRALSHFGLELSTAPAPGPGLERAKEAAAEDDVILVTGSFYVISDLMQSLGWKQITGME